MILRIIAVGDKMPDWVETGFYEYAKRFPPHCKLTLCEIPAEKRTKNPDIKRLMQLEGERMLTLIKPSHLVIALEVKGKMWDTHQLSNHLAQWQMDGKDIDFLIGGADGLSPACLERANLKWSLSPLTLPHMLVRIILSEQLYRAISLLQGHPYHK